MNWESPFVSRSKYDELWRENVELRTALRNANTELRKHRIFIGGLRDGHEQTINTLEKVLAKK